MLKGAPNPKEGRLFIEYILSDAGQKAWMLKTGEPGGPPTSTLSRLAILPSVYQEVQGKTLITINPFEKTSFIRYNVQQDEELWDVFNDLMGMETFSAEQSMLRDTLRRLFREKVAKKPP